MSQLSRKARSAFIVLLPTIALASSGLAGEAVTSDKKSVLADLLAMPMWPLWIASAVMVTLIFERAFALRKKKVMDTALPETMQSLLSGHKVQEAIEACEQSGTVMGRAWGQGLREFMLGGMSMKDALTDASVLNIKPLKRNLQGIATIATIAPLLGLLGTIIGMVQVFNQISLGGTDKEKLAAGIMTALFTTAFGLIIAIPGIISNRYLSAKVVRFAEEMETDINNIAYAYEHRRVMKARQQKAAARRQASGNRPAAAARA